VKARRGHLLAEALCALALAGLLATAAALALGGARRALASTDRTARADRAARETVEIVAAMLVDADSLSLEGDTAATLTVTIGVGAICARAGGAVVLPPVAVSSGLPITVRSQPWAAGDLISVLVADSLAREAQWVWAEVDSVTGVTSASPCGSAEGWLGAGDLGAERPRLVLRPALPDPLPSGAPVRILRRGRLALYASGGDWMLGWRRCSADGLTCGAVQPVAGPLRSPAAGGLRMIRNAVSGEVLVQAAGVGAARPARLTVRRSDGA
jgi:hypothetical protein